MYSLDEIKEVHLEISSKCNATCPLCPRNCHGYNHNFGYEERNLSLYEIKKIFTKDILKQLKRILINGNFGDMVMNTETPDIVDYFLSVNKNIEIEISTNGGARNQQFWKKLGNMPISIDFCIDGVDDTHSLYRRNTRFETVIRNAKTYISAGGIARWKFIEFDHNRHQTKLAEDMANHLGFAEFFVVKNSHGAGVVLNKSKQVIYAIDEELIMDYSKYSTKELFYVADSEQLTEYPEIKNIECEASKDKSVYINSVGEVYPCCYLGFNPRTYASPGMAVYNQQIKKILKPNNAIEHPLEECIAWFASVKKTWSKDWRQGRLLKCNDQCGKCKKL